MQGPLGTTPARKSSRLLWVVSCRGLAAGVLSVVNMAAVADYSPCTVIVNEIRRMILWHLSTTRSVIVTMMVEDKMQNRTMRQTARKRVICHVGFVQSLD